tara:strand:+ start:1390 stop:2094 length:705 start_codon:yes stop_codon:yes gene_type:complete
LSEQGKTLQPGSIKDRQISGQAKIKHGKLAKVADAQILVGGADEKLSAQTVSGDATLANDGTLTLDSANIEAKVKSVLTELEIEAGAGKNMTAGEIKKIYEEIPGVNRFNNNYANDLKYASSVDGESTLVKRDADGKVELKTDNFVYPDQTTTETNGDSTITTSSAPTVIEFVPNTSNYPAEFSHTFGYIPDVTVFKIVSAGTYEMIDAEVTASTSNVSVDVSDRGISTRIVAK